MAYNNGDAQITDFPACSARRLAPLVQSCDDLLAHPDGYLLPEDSVVAPDLGRQTVSSGRSLSQSRAAPTDLTITRVDLRPTNAELVRHVRLDVCGLARYVRGHPATG
jgi:hypothetical protein